MARVLLAAAMLLAAAPAPAAELAIQQWGATERFSHPKTLKIAALAEEDKSAGPWVITIDLKDLPKDAQVLQASLHAGRPVVWGNKDDAAVEVEIVPLAAAPAGKEPRTAGKPLALRPPWFDSFDATELVRSWAKDPKSNHGLLVKAFPAWQQEQTYLEIVYQAKVKADVKQVKDVKALHRAGQTFITFAEIDSAAKEKMTYGELRSAMDEPARRISYRIYRHGQAVTAANLDKAQLLGEVGQFSAYNVNGRSVDELIAQVRRAAIDDLDLAKRLAKNDYFSRYNPEMPEMAQVAINRLAIQDGQPLPLGTGLYVHQPERPGNAYYAVIACADGTANSSDLSAANSLASPIDEAVGIGEPVLQGTANVTVFFDYPGTRQQYVQWAAPSGPGNDSSTPGASLANLPNSYYNWGVFVPRDYGKGDARRLSVCFHDSQQRFLKPAWPHRRDTVLLSPHDYPFASFGYGYHESLGTLRSFNQGNVQPFFARRVDAVLAWAMKKFDANPACVSVGGSGYWGGTAAVQYGVRRPGKVAYVMADSNFDPDPQALPPNFDREKTARPMTEAVWGKADMACQTDSGKVIWDEMNLPAYVLAAKAALPFMSLGAGSQHQTWKQESDLMKAYMESRNAFMAEFWWGSTPHIHLPVTAETGDVPFEPRTNQPMLACKIKSLDVDAKFYETYFLTGKRGYAAGSRINTRPRWSYVDVVDQPERLELTIFSANVTYAGSETTEVTLRNAQQFKPAAGAKVKWTVTDKAGKGQAGEVVVDEKGLTIIPALTFAGQGRLVISKE